MDIKSTKACKTTDWTYHRLVVFIKSMPQAHCKYIYHHNIKCLGYVLQYISFPSSFVKVPLKTVKVLKSHNVFERYSHFTTKTVFTSYDTSARKCTHTHTHIAHLHTHTHTHPHTHTNTPTHSHTHIHTHTHTHTPTHTHTHTHPSTHTNTHTHTHTHTYTYHLFPY